MARFKLCIEYAGTRYSGWQVQRNARTVQGELLEAVARAAGRNDGQLYGSGRTDAGVHALQQVAHLDLETPLPAETLRRAVNDELPPDIHVLAVESVSRRFHARHDAVARSYLYQISRRRTALAKAFVWWIKDPLDAGRMAAAANRCVGLHDFRSFTDLDPEESETRVRLEAVRLEAVDDLILVRVVGSHFVWKLVRRLVGVLVEVGRGRLTADDVARFLREPSDLPARHTAPPSGLFLERVFYAVAPRDWPLRPAMAVWTAPRDDRPQPGRDEPPRRETARDRGHRPRPAARPAVKGGRRRGP